MITAFITYAPIMGLLFFFGVFLAIIAWVLFPANRKRLQAYGQIPLHEEFYGNE